MKKTKAIFAAAMIVVVASVSAVCWYLNEQGVFGKEDASVSADEYVQQEDAAFDDENDVIQAETTTETATEKTVTKNEINEFLTVFAKAYFSESSAYTPETRSNYELLRFAYAYISVNEPSKIGQYKEDGKISTYNCVNSQDVNEVLKKYLDVAVPEESVYTENDYAFFKFEDGRFLVPAAGGLPYENTAKAGVVEQNGDNLSVRFEIFTGEQLYATGEAGIKLTDSGLVLTYYSVNRM